MAADLRTKFGLNSELVQSSGGVFEIEFKDKLLFSKHSLGRFPEDNEVQDLIRGEHHH
ncbi:Rdx family protein [bacterium]|nr:Rdx family protein [bacterium]QQR59007.1 MAG: Rdx family protein [Candidatus Melainabacteria bacterium]